MLKALHISHYILIDSLDVEFPEGLIIITGQTGAGKSILMGALSLLTGAKADAAVISEGADNCVVEGEFRTDDPQVRAILEENGAEWEEGSLLVRRVVHRSGRSRSFVNDCPVPVTLLQEVGGRLVDIHSQHQNLLLNKQDFQLSVVDVIANDAKELAKYQQTYQAYQTVKNELDMMKADIERNRQNLDFLQFQCNELSEANLQSGEQEELEQKSETMEHSEDIKSALYTADNALSAEDNGVVVSLRNSLSSLKAVEHVFPDVSEYVQRIEESYIELKDLAQDINTQLENIDFDPSELDIINNRLDRLYDLEKKPWLTWSCEWRNWRNKPDRKPTSSRNCESRHLNR